MAYVLRLSGIFVTVDPGLGYLELRRKDRAVWKSGRNIGGEPMDDGKKWRLAAIAKDRERSLNFLMVEAVEQYLGREEAK